jgi:cation diffusion facilitator CzcD-associated flavoprotein CzcO
MSDRMSVAVVGAGLGGLAAGIKLKEAGFSGVSIFEKADKVGGTWRQNTYPGCSCDVPVALYQYSFAPAVHWTNTFPTSGEVQQYAEQLADTFQLRPSLNLGEGIARAVWNENQRHWDLTTTKGRTVSSRALVAALGQLDRPRFPDIPGRDSFAGPSFHSAGWDHSVDLVGKRVAVIGSAASAVQLIPEVAKVAGHLVVFQRTPNWIGPRRDAAITAQEVALLMTNPEAAMDIGARQRHLIFDNAETFFWQAFSWTPEGREAYRQIAVNHLESQIADPVLRAKLTPDYPVGCTRYLFADTFYPALTRPNVTLETSGIASIDATGIRTSEGVHHDLDVIVYATGFETTGWHWSMEVIGTGGTSLADTWALGPDSYLGITTAGFPNLFMLYGPNTNLGHNSITFMLERQIEYVVQALTGLEKQGAAAMDVTRAAQDRFQQQLQADLGKTTWADPHCHSWYKNNLGKITQNWSGNCTAYAAEVKDVKWDDYALA